MEVDISSRRERDNTFGYESVSSPINTKKEPTLIILFPWSSKKAIQRCYSIKLDNFYAFRLVSLSGSIKKS